MHELRPLSLLQRVHLDEACGGMKGLYTLLAEPAELSETDAPQGTERRAHISRQNLRKLLGIFIEKLENIRRMDDEAGFSTLKPRGKTRQ